MKKIIFAILACCLALAACTKEDSSPKVSFETALPVTTDDESTLTLKVEGYTAAEPVTIPVTFTSDAIEGTDYEVSAKAFVVGGASPVTKITVKTLKFDSNKKVTATLSVPQGFQPGQYMTNVVTLSGKIGYASFVSKNSIMTDKINVSLAIYDGQGNMKRLEKGDKIAVRVNTEKSTAVEGTHFKFSGEKVVTIEPGKNSGTISLDIIGEPVKDKDLIVLDIEAGDKYSIGQNISAYISIAGSTFNKLGGKWVIDKIVTDKEYMKGMWGFDASNEEEQLGAFPVLNTEDSFTIDVEAATFTPDFKSGFKNYFTGVSNITKDMTVILRGIGSKTDLQTFNFDNINRNFSAKTNSDNKNAIVGIQLIKNETGEDILDMYIIDYTPTDFLGMLVEFGTIDASIKPTTATGGKDTLEPLSGINVTFKKAK